jgi:hypothetical protein
MYYPGSISSSFYFLDPKRWDWNAYQLCSLLTSSSVSCFIRIQTLEIYCSSLDGSYLRAIFEAIRFFNSFFSCPFSNMIFIDFVSYQFLYILSFKCSNICFGLVLLYFCLFLLFLYWDYHVRLILRVLWAISWL